MKNTMVEWDDKIPEFTVLEAELGKAREAARTAKDHGALPKFENTLPPRVSNMPTPYAAQQERMQKALLERDGEQEREEHLHARQRDAQLLQELGEVAVRPLDGSLVAALLHGTRVALPPRA